MRDIVSSGYNSSTLPTKNKVVRMNSGTARGEYRSYRDFLESYGDKNSKDDQESVSSTDSGISSSCKLSESKSNNTSTSSLNSEINGSSSKVSQKSESNLMTTRTGSFRNYLESYNNKKFSSVKPTVAPTQNIIKSEILIQVNDPLEQPKNEPEKVFMTTINGDKGEDKTDAAINTVPRPSLGNYKEIRMALSHCFESQHELNKINGTTNLSQSQLELLNDETNKILPPPPPPPPEPKINCGDRHSATNDFIPPPPPPPILNLNNPQIKHTTAKKWETVKVNNSDSSANQQNPPEKLPTNNAAAANLAKILTQHLLPRRKELERLEQNETKNGATTSSLCEITENGSKSQGIEIKNQKCKTYVSVIPKLPSQQENKQTPKLPSSPPPPVPKEQQSPPFFMQSKSFVPSSSVLTKQVKNGENSGPPKFPIFSPTMSRRMLNVDTTLPKPSLKQSQKIADLQKSFSSTTVTSEVPRLPQTPPPKVTSGRNSPNVGGNVEFITTTVVPVTDTATKVSKNDPNVRKLVYNTYRGLLGAYNNKANDMIATLPRTMVREDKGVCKQLESIALQGGLEKLNGRTNPKVEKE